MMELMSDTKYTFLTQIEPLENIKKILIPPTMKHKKTIITATLFLSIWHKVTLRELSVEITTKTSRFLYFRREFSNY